MTLLNLPTSTSTNHVNTQVRQAGNFKLDFRFYLNRDANFCVEFQIKISLWADTLQIR